MSVLDLKFPPVISAFVQSDARFRLIDGPFGSGKSVGCMIDIVRRAMQQARGSDGVRRSRWAVVRNTMPMLRDTTLKTWFQWFPDGGGAGWWKETGKTFYLEFGDVRAEVIFRALDDEADVKNLLSLELTGAYLNEAREIVQKIVEGLRGRIDRYPSIKMGGCTWAGIWGDTNPPEEGSYWHALEEKLDPETGQPRGNDLALFRQPGGMIRVTDGGPYEVKMRNGWLLRTNPKAENLENLAPGYYKNQCVDASDEYIKTYVLGMYGQSKAGKPVHPLFDPEYHVAKDILRPNPHLLLLLAADFGHTPAIAFKQQDVHGRVLTLDEVVTEGMGLKRCIDEKLKPLLRNKYPNYNIFVTGDPAGNQGAQTDERTCVQIFKQSGFRNVKFAYSNNPIHRQGATDHYLARRTEIGAGYIISPNCTYSVRGMKGGYHWKVLKNGLQSDEVDKNIYSHICEAGQYGDMYYYKGVIAADTKSSRSEYLEQLKRVGSTRGSYTRRT